MYHQSLFVPSIPVWIDDRKRGHVCRLMTSETSLAQYGPHRLIIANHEKSSSAFLNNMHHAKSLPNNSRGAAPHFKSHMINLGLTFEWSLTKKGALTL